MAIKILSREEIHTLIGGRPRERWFQDIIDSHEELRRRLDAAQTRLQAEADRCARTAHPFGHDREEWLMDIIRDLSFDAIAKNLVKNTIVKDVSRDESKT